MFSNAKGNALWESIEKESGMPVSMIMNVWITKPGIQKSMDDYYMNWLDEKIPALEGKTPREAANDPLF